MTDVRLRWDVRIPMRDGVWLSAILYLPANHSQPTPVLFTMTPYIAQTHHERGMYFASHGFPFLSVDVRGRGNSPGEFHPRHEAEDGYDIVEWLAVQPYCNGNVSMYGSSYLGYCQWRTAGERPPHLATIIPVAAAFQGMDFPMRGNVFMSYVVQWLALVAGRTLQDKMFSDRSVWSRKFADWMRAGVAFKRLDECVFGTSLPLFQEWMSHPQLDRYWDSLNPTAEQYARLSIPILTITGAYDADQPGALEHYRQHMRNASPQACARHYLIIGPWNHAGCAFPQAQFDGLTVGPQSVLDMGALHRQWYAWTMQAGERPPFLRAPVAYYVTGADRWRYAQSLEAVTAYSIPLFLHSTNNPTDVFASGSLELESAESPAPDQYVYDPRDVSLLELESRIDPNNLMETRLVHARFGKQLVYHSAQFERDTVIAGFFRLSLWLSIDRPDTDFRAAVYEIALDGSAVLLTKDSMRARYRESSREAKLIDTSEPLLYEFESFLFVGRRIRRGSRLRLVVGPLHSMYWQKNYNSGKSVSDESMDDAQPVTVKLFHGLAYPSALHVPYGHADDDEE
jgi:uncharacterized protein